jgi:predicted RND superfamily exporter protein
LVVTCRNFLPTIAIIILLLVAFPRPLIGLLALLPSAAGTMLALFFYSLFHPSMTMMAIGFGSAIISFTVCLLGDMSLKRHDDNF